MPTLPDVTCNNCKSVNNYHTEQSGPHIKAICNGCGKYIKFLPQGCTPETIMFYGKYNGHPLKHIPPEYFIWLYENTKVSGSLKTYIEDNLTKFRTLINEAK